MIDILYNIGYVALTIVVLALIIAAIETWGCRK